MCLDFKRRETTCERRECDHHRAAISLLEDPAKRLIRARGFSVKTFLGRSKGEAQRGRTRTPRAQLQARRDLVDAETEQSSFSCKRGREQLQTRAGAPEIQCSEIRAGESSSHLVRSTCDAYPRGNSRGDGSKYRAILARARGNWRVRRFIRRRHNDYASP